MKPSMRVVPRARRSVSVRRTSLLQGCGPEGEPAISLVLRRQALPLRKDFCPIEIRNPPPKPRVWRDPGGTIREPQFIVRVLHHRQKLVEHVAVLRLPAGERNPQARGPLVEQRGDPAHTRQPPVKALRYGQHREVAISQRSARVRRQNWVGDSVQLSELV